MQPDSDIYSFSTKHLNITNHNEKQDVQEHEISKIF